MEVGNEKMDYCPTTSMKSATQILEGGSHESKFWKLALLFAKENKASDIHIEPTRKGIDVRFRLNGVMKREESFCLTLGPIQKGQFLNTMKLICSANIGSQTTAQDRSFYYETTNSEYRVGITPTPDGEHIVLRVIDDSISLNLESLGLEDDIVEALKQSVKKKQGLILVTGPTGQGKSTTLQATLQTLNLNEQKVISIENPKERDIEGVIQTEITDVFTWTDAIKMSLRQDPDVIFIGEIRDKESAQLAVDAVETGHLVISTLHTRSVASTFARLLSFGVSREQLSDTVTFLSSQRLVSVLCNDCKIPEGQYFARNKKGCAKCGGLGLIKKIPVAEFALSPTKYSVMNMSEDEFEKEIVKHTLQDKVRELEKRGLVEAGLSKSYAR